MAEQIDTLSKIVFSQMLSHVEWGKWENARLAKEDLRETIAALKQEPGKALLAASTAMFIPTAGHSITRGPFAVWRSTSEWVELGWKEFGVLELTALPSIRQEYWLPQLEAADVLLVGGGENLYLCY